MAVLVIVYGHSGSGKSASLRNFDPEQVAVIGVDNTLYGQLCTPALTTLDNKLGEVSLAAANMLLDVLQDRPVSHKLMLLTEIIQREST